MNTDDLIRTLKLRAGFEVVSNNASANQVRLLGRVPHQLVRGWLIVLRQVLLRGEEAPWSIDASKQYFLRGGKVMFGWRIIFQAENVEQHLADVCQTIINAPRPKAVVDSKPLVGASPDRNAPRDGSLKGASLSGQHLVGPLAVAAMRGR